MGKLFHSFCMDGENGAFGVVRACACLGPLKSEIIHQLIA